MNGAGGVDRFIFDSANFGDDTIVQFQDGVDLIEISYDSSVTFDSLTITQVTSDVRIDTSEGSITLRNRSVSDIDESDFSFVLSVDVL
ncbi:MAG: hypothetical protein AAFV62_10175 [Pseudomonadota bacterium]